MADANFKTSADRIDAGVAAGDEYVTDLETIKDDLDVNAATDGASLGAMVGAQLEMTEAETQYQVDSSLPKKAQSAAKEAAAAVKQAVS